MRKLLVAVALVIMGIVAALIVGARGSGEGPQDGGAEQAGQAAESASTTEAATISSAWVTEEEMRMSQEGGDEDGLWVVGFFGSSLRSTGRH